MNSLLFRQIIRFLSIGCFTTLLSYSIFYLLYRYIHCHYLVASGIGFLSGVLIGYFLNKNWTFSVKKKGSHFIVKYYTVYLISFILGTGCMYILVSHLQFTAEIANILTLFLTTCTNFTGIKIWAFKK